jgi:hypothetical protein
MTTSHTIPRAEWRTYFERLSQQLLGKRIEIEAAALDLGDQIVAEWVPLFGITYDSRDDLLDVALAGLNHLIRHPREIYVQEGSHGVETIAVATEGDVKQILRLKDPIMLPAPRGDSV